jgi:hypothetical protein
MISIGSITSANASMTMTAAGLFTAPQQIYQFDVDDMFDSEAVENGQIEKGVDGYIAAGWLPTQPKLNLSLRANSPSVGFFDLLFQTEQQSQSKILLQGVISVPAISTQYNLLNGYLMNFMHLAPAKKVLQGRKYVLVLDDITYSALS